MNLTDGGQMVVIIHVHVEDEYTAPHMVSQPAR